MKKGMIFSALICLVLATLLVMPQQADATAEVYRLSGDETIALSGETLLVDLAGYDLTVTGEGRVELIDTANDNYDAAACGTLTADGAITVERSATAEGKTYVAVKENGSVTAHRLDMEITTVSLRMTTAGLYYKSRYTCDTVLAEKVQAYGVVLSVRNMPGADFKTQPTDCYTVAKAPFESGVVATSGAVFNIVKDTLDGKTNLQRSSMPIYANAYVDLGDGPIVADTENAGKIKTNPGFDGIAYSLQDVLVCLDEGYENLSKDVRIRLDNFCAQWQEKGVDWEFQKIGSTTTNLFDNSDIEEKFRPGTTDALCPVCKENVTWTPIYNDQTSYDLETDATQTHYYLAEDVTYNGTTTFFQSRSKVADTCVHLNGHNVTATQEKVFFGSNSRTNIVGNGIVTGYQSNGNEGAALQINNYTENNGLYVYGGTYRKTEDSHATAAVVCINTVGGTIKLYEGVTVEAADSIAVRARKPVYKDAQLDVIGATINGDIELLGPGTGKTSSATFFDCEISGKVTVAAGTEVYLQGSPVITAVALAGYTYLNLNEMETGAAVGIVNHGVFTESLANPNDYLAYFYSADGKKEITVREDALFCGTDLIGSISSKFQPGTTDALCPVCEEIVTWTPVYNDQTFYDLETDETQTHYYLAEDVTYNGTTTFFQSRSKVADTCFHLNDHNVTATQTLVFFGSNSRTNIMGKGVVTGYQKTAGRAAALEINNSYSTSSLYVYGGTYRKSAGSNEDAFVTAIQGVGSSIYLYEDVVIEATDNNAIYVKKPIHKNAQLSVYGATVYGDVELLGPGVKRTATAEFYDCKISGKVTVAAETVVKLQGSPEIAAVDLAEDTYLNLNEMRPGAAVGIVNSGVFAGSLKNPDEYLAYFYSEDGKKEIMVREDALFCGFDFTGNISPKFQPGTTDALCPACEEIVTWIPVYNDQTFYNLETDETQTHYYLAEDVTYTGTTTFFQSRSKVANTCFHLNGHNLTATQEKVFFGSNSLTSILGNGIVTGYQSSDKEGAALQINNYIKNNGLHVYGGTYRKTEDSHASAAVVCVYSVGGTIKLYEDVTIEAADSIAVRVNKPIYKDAQLDVFGATVNGDVVLMGATDCDFAAYATFADCVINGNVEVASDSNVTLSGAVQINKLTIPAGELVSFGELAEGAAVKVSASGTFTKTVISPEDWVKYVTCENAEDWVIVKDKQLYQGEKLLLTPATQADQTVLNTAYAGKTLKFGDFHGHTSTAGADGKNTLAEWVQEIERLRIDFATVVDHRQSIHMHMEEFTEDLFIGGSEPGMKLTDSKAENTEFDFSMVFADVTAFESLLDRWSDTFCPYQDANYPGYRFQSAYGNYGLTTARYEQLVQDVYNAGGIIILVHPKQKGYLTSDDPLDYYFGENSCLEITTGLKLSNGDGGNMCAPSNEKAYRLWTDLLYLGKKVWATAGSDQHRLPDASGLNAVYTAEDHRDHYIAALRAGNTAPGWMGIRMNIGDAVMGGQTDFTDQRLVFSVGDIYTGDASEKEPVYQKDHEYRVELYDNNGLLMEYPIDPTQMNYFALDCDANAKLYRVVVWDDTANTRVGVSNPIWNSAN